jgi:hypothetical protein
MAQTVGAHTTKNYNEENGARAVIGGSLDVVSGGELNVESGGALKLDGTAITALASELNVFAGAANGAPGIVVGAEGGGGTTINVAIQLNKADGNPAAMRQVMLAYLSDDANGDSIVAAAPSGGWAIGTDGLLIPIVAGKCGYLVSEADGDIDVTITEAGAKTCYLILVHPSGKISSSGAITFAA